MIRTYEDEDGDVYYELVCTTCGLIFRVTAYSGIELAKIAIECGWGWMHGVFSCPSCKVEDWEYVPVVQPGWRPKNEAKREWVCGRCKNVTKSQKAPGKKCPKCKEVLWPNLT